MRGADFDSLSCCRFVRQEIIDELMEVAKDKGWEARYFMRYNLAGTVREAIVDQAKVSVVDNRLALSNLLKFA